MTNATVALPVVFVLGNSVPSFARARLEVILTKDEIRDMKEMAGSWRSLGRAMKLPPMTLWRYANDKEYVPKRKDIRLKLGLETLPKFTYVLQIREPDGTFGKQADEVASPR